VKTTYRVDALEEEERKREKNNVADGKPEGEEDEKKKREKLIKRARKFLATIYPVTTKYGAKLADIATPLFQKAVLNGELWFDGESWELKQHKKDNYFISQVPITYDPAARCPEFEKALAEYFSVSRYDEENDKEKALLDKRQRTQSFLEGLGYSLMMTTALQTCWILFGPSSTAKSVLLKVIRCIVGIDNVYVHFYSRSCMTIKES
jgi:phage/plasmid-associated DNA primase